MNTKRFLITASLALFVLILALLSSQAAISGQALPAAALASPVGTAFTYQGQLKSEETPYDGTCDFQFGLWDALADGAQFGITLTKLNVSVNEGFFAVQLDWGANAFQGDARWLEISVRCPAGGGDYTLLTPRQPLTPTPYALYVAGTWRTTGNAGTTPGTHYLGTSDNVALELKVDGARALRLEPNATSPNLIGGHSGNWVSSGVYGATIGGGGGANPNSVTDAHGTVGGGRNNQAGDNAGTAEDAGYATVSGGSGNLASAEWATVAGGRQNTAGSESAFVGGGNENNADGASATIAGGAENIAGGGNATVGGGRENTAGAEDATISGGWANMASGNRAVIGGGDHNTANGEWSPTIAGGSHNTASGNFAVVGGGSLNTASNSKATVAGGDSNTASSPWATVAGGAGNVASGDAATVPGGQDNLAQGSHSFAAGFRAKANNQGCFVWADLNDVDLVCDVDNRWVARASGGVYFYTHYQLASGVYVAEGGNSWNGVSDRASKENLTPADGQAILETLASLPIQEYNLKSQDPSIRHIGPVAQDFAALGYGESDTAINMQDTDGVALAAIQALYQQVQTLETENADLESRVAALEAAASSSGGSTHHWRAGLLPGLGLLALGLVWVARRGGGR